MTRHSNPARPPDEAWAQLTGELADFLPSRELDAARGPGDVSFEHPLPVWHLGVRSLVRDSRSLDELAEPTGDWHAQVRERRMEGGVRAPRLIGFAHVWRPPGESNRWEIGSVFLSASTAARIEAGLRAWRRQEAALGVDVRLLSLPGYQLYALWVVSPDRQHVLILDAPSEYKLQLADEPEAVWLTAEEFLSAVRSREHIQGLE